MPRGKFMNHKGRLREFTPVEELRREQELEVILKQDCESPRINDNDNYNKRNVQHCKNGNNGNINNERAKKFGGAVEGLIEISNPNRVVKKKPAMMEDQVENTPVEKRRSDMMEKQRANGHQKTSSEMKADIERLMLVRKKREAAAELRLAAKMENSNNAELASSKSDMFLNKKSTKLGQKSSDGALNIECKNDTDVKKLVKTRNGNKRNGLLQF